MLSRMNFMGCEEDQRGYEIDRYQLVSRSVDGAIDGQLCDSTYQQQPRHRGSPAPEMINEQDVQQGVVRHGEAEEAEQRIALEYFAPKVAFTTRCGSTTSNAVPARECCRDGEARRQELMRILVGCGA